MRVVLNYVAIVLGAIAVVGVILLAFMWRRCGRGVHGFDTVRCDMNGFMAYTAVIGLTICAAVGIVAVIAWLAEQFAGDEEELWMDEDWGSAVGRERG